MDDLEPAKKRGYSYLFGGGGRTKLRGTCSERLLIVLTLFGGFIGGSVNSVVLQRPKYQERIDGLTSIAISWLTLQGLDLSAGGHCPVPHARRQSPTTMFWFNERGTQPAEGHTTS